MFQGSVKILLYKKKKILLYVLPESVDISCGIWCSLGVVIGSPKFESIRKPVSVEEAGLIGSFHQPCTELHCVLEKDMLQF